MEGHESRLENEISPEAHILARKIIGADEARLKYLMSSETAVELNERRKEMMNSAAEQFSSEGIRPQMGERALVDTLMRLWMAEHPTPEKSQE